MMKKQPIDKILVGVVQGSFSIFAWKSIEGLIVKCEMKIKAIRREINELEFEVAAGETKKISQLINSDQTLDCYIPASSVSFKVHIKQAISDSRVKTMIPLDYEFFERRRNARVQPRKLCYLSFEYLRNNMKRPLFDISIGGVAIILPKAEKMTMHKGAKLERCLLEINGKKIKLTLECVASITFDRFKSEELPYGGHKIAFRFAGMSKEDREFITDFVTSETILSKGLKGA